MRRRSCACRGSAVTVRGGEIPNRLASDEIRDKLAFFYERNALSLHAFIVERIFAEERLAGNSGNRGVVVHVDEIGKHPGFVTAGPRARGPGVLAELGFAAQDVGLDQIAHYGARGVVRKKNWAAVFLVNYWSVAQHFQRSQHLGGAV